MRSKKTEGLHKRYAQFGTSRTPSPTMVQSNNIVILGDKCKDCAFKGPLSKGAGSRKADWGIRVTTTHNLNRS